MNIFNICSNEHFFEALLKGVEERLAIKKENFRTKWADVKIIFPNRRACRNFTEFMITYYENQAFCLPKIIAISDLDAENLPQKQKMKPISKIRQRMMVTRLIHDLKLIEQQNQHSLTRQSFRVAIDLINLLADFHDAQIAFADFEKLIEIEMEKTEFAAHWQKNAQFLKVIFHFLPQIMAEKNLIDYSVFRDLMIEKQANAWSLEKNGAPIIFAGLDSQIKSVTNLFKSLKNQKNCFFVLNGFHAETFASGKNQDLAKSHFQFKFAKLFREAGLDHEMVQNWCSVLKKNGHEISRIFDDFNWKNNKLDTKISLINAQDLQEEAKIIALAIKKFLFENQENNKKIAIVTFDRDLSLRLIEQLKKWKIEFNDSEGFEFSKTKAGDLFFLLVELHISKFSPVNILKFLKHSLICKNEKFVMDIEMDFFRGLKFYDGFSELHSHIHSRNPEMGMVLKEIYDKNGGFFEEFDRKTGNFKFLLEKHLEFFLALVDENDAEILEFVEFIREILDSASEFETINYYDYLKILDTIFVGHKFRAKSAVTARVSLINPNEAGLLNFDLTICASMNEGNFPPSEISDPWLSRALKEKLGLNSSEENLGQWASLFVSLLSQKQVILTRSTKIDGSETICSRFVTHLLMFLEKNSVQIDETIFWRRICEIADFGKNENLPKKFARPCFAPGLQFLLQKASVSKIEQLIKDPYGYYVSEILSIKKLKDIDQELTAVDFGNFIHALLDEFNKKYENHENAAELLQKIGNEMLAKYYHSPALLAVWKPRFVKISEWILEFEKNRREKSLKIFSEIPGKVEMNLGNGKKFTLVGKSDRIEIKENSEFSLLDYKTGLPPTATEVRKAVAPQLLIEALMLTKGVFKQEIAKCKNGDLVYVRLTGRKNAGEIQIIDLKEELPDFLERFEKSLQEMLEFYFVQGSPFMAIPNVKNAPKYNDYEHLERLDDWA